MTKPSDVLIVYGGLPLHEPKATSEIVAQLLRQHGLTVEITDDYAALGDSSIFERRLVIPNITGGDVAPEIVHSLANAVRQGVGLGGHHHSLSTTFRSSLEFHYMTGSIFVGHPGDIRSYRVEITAPEDPIMQGIDDFFYVSEQYYMLLDPSLEVLATTTFDGKADPVTTGVVMPVVYKKHFERGRIFFSALGHVASEFERTEMREILVRGLLWAARQ